MHLASQQRQSLRGYMKPAIDAQQRQHQPSKTSPASRSKCHPAIREIDSSWVQYRHAFDPSSNFNNCDESWARLLATSLPRFGQRCRFHALDADIYTQTSTSNDACTSPVGLVVLTIRPTMRGTKARCITIGFKREKAGVLDIETQRKMDPRL